MRQINPPPGSRGPASLAKCRAQQNTAERNRTQPRWNIAESRTRDPERNGTQNTQNAERSGTQPPRTQQNAARVLLERSGTQNAAEHRAPRTQQNTAVFIWNAADHRTQDFVFVF